MLDPEYFRKIAEQKKSENDFSRFKEAYPKFYNWMNDVIHFQAESGQNMLLAFPKKDYIRSDVELCRKYLIYCKFKVSDIFTNEIGDLYFAFSFYDHIAESHLNAYAEALSEERKQKAREMLICSQIEQRCNLTGSHIQSEKD